MDHSYEKGQTWLQYLIPSLFIALVYCIQQQNIQISFLTAGVLLLSLAFFSEKNRMVLWISIAYLFGQLLYMYAIKFVDLIDVSVAAAPLLNRLMLICILAPISIVYFSFIKKTPVELGFPSRLTCFVLRTATLNLKQMITLIFFISTIVFIPAIYLNRAFITTPGLTYGLAFCLINAVFQELIWRGILLTAFKVQTTPTVAILATGLGFGITQSTLGFQLYGCLLFSLIGSLLSWLTLKTNSLLPSFLIFFYLSFLLVLSGVIFTGS